VLLLNSFFYSLFEELIIRLIHQEWFRFFQWIAAPGIARRISRSFVLQGHTG
jgi:hypothetical protein